MTLADIQTDITNLIYYSPESAVKCMLTIGGIRDIMVRVDAIGLKKYIIMDIGDSYDMMNEIYIILPDKESLFMFTLSELNEDEWMAMTDQEELFNDLRENAAEFIEEKKPFYYVIDGKFCEIVFGKNNGETYATFYSNT